MFDNDSVSLFAPVLTSGLLLAQSGATKWALSWLIVVLGIVLGGAAVIRPTSRREKKETPEEARKRRRNEG